VGIVIEALLVEPETVTHLPQYGIWYSLDIKDTLKGGIDGTTPVVGQSQSSIRKAANKWL